MTAPTHVVARNRGLGVEYLLPDGKWGEKKGAKWMPQKAAAESARLWSADLYPCWTEPA